MKFSVFLSENILLILRPGHGAPTQDIRKKKFTEHQMNNLTRSQSLFGLDTDLNCVPAAPMQRLVRCDIKIKNVRILLSFWARPSPPQRADFLL